MMTLRTCRRGCANVTWVGLGGWYVDFDSGRFHDGAPIVDHICSRALRLESDGGWSPAPSCCFEEFVDPFLEKGAAVIRWHDGGTIAFAPD